MTPVDILVTITPDGEFCFGCGHFMAVASSKHCFVFRGELKKTEDGDLMRLPACLAAERAAQAKAQGASVSIPRKAVDGMGNAAVMAASMGGVPGVPVKTILEAWGVTVEGA